MCMANIAENLHVILKEKNDLKNSINAKNAGAITDSTPFSAYPNSISAIETRTLDMSDRVVSDCFELKDYTDSEFTVKKCIKEVNIPTTVTSLGQSCFENCSSLTGISIPDSVTSLGNSCFGDCSGLTSVTIPEYVTSLGNWCFAYSPRLASVTCKATTPPTLGGLAFYQTHSTMVIYVPAESVDAYKSATNWSSYASKIQAIS